MGDADGDGKVTAKDSLLIMRYAIKLKTFSKRQLRLSDVSGDGRVTNKDALDILRYTINMSNNKIIGTEVTI